MRSRFSCLYKFQKTLAYSSLFALFFFLLSSTGFSQGDPVAGETYFNNTCATCHFPTDKINVGPGLKGVQDRWADKSLLYTWIKEPKKAEATGDSYVRDLLKKNRAKGTPDMVALGTTDVDIDNLLAYIDAYVPPVKDELVENDIKGGDANDSNSWLWFIILALIFATIVLSLSGVKRQLQNAQLIQEGKEPIPAMSYGKSFKNWASNNKAFVSVIGIFLTMWCIAWLYGMGMDDVGVYGGKEGNEDKATKEDVDHKLADLNYAPSQPIKFSHALHAGDNAIACIYCHSTAEKSKTPSIPSVNVCMNCHIAIDEGPKHGKVEIQKIYDAIGFDGDEKVYIEDYTEQPIQWVKVHDLPDHVYFNHSQHIKVAGLECEACHGNVKEMDVIEQVAPLTMGWCIQCHNETEVKQEDNGYYDEIHKRLIQHDNGRALLREYLSDQTITARELGGWECSKCHY